MKSRLCICRLRLSIHAVYLQLQWRMSPGFTPGGEDNAELWRQYPQLPQNAVIDVTGNPRNDLPRPELHAYYDNEVAKIKNANGDFILVNTNFNHVNAFTPVQNLFQPVENAGETPKFGRAAKGMSREYADGLRAHKQAIFEDSQRMIPALDEAFPDGLYGRSAL